MLKVSAICGEAQEGLEDRQKRDDFQTNVGDRVLGETEQLTEEMLLEVGSREEHDRHLTHLEEEHARVAALASCQLLFHPVQDVGPILESDGEAKDDQQRPDCSHPARERARLVGTEEEEGDVALLDHCRRDAVREARELFQTVGVESPIPGWKYLSSNKYVNDSLPGGVDDLLHVENGKA